MTTIQQLDALHNLSPDWDCTGCGPISPEAIEAAKELSEFFEDLHVSPTYDGGVELELGSMYSRLCFEVHSSGKIDYELYCDNRTETGTVSLEDQKIAELALWARKIQWEDAFG